MQANELRIGNHILLKDKVVKLCGVTDNGFYVYEDRNSVFNLIEKAKPIELTEEILLKCGFEFKPKGEEVYEQFWICNDFEIWQHSEGFCHDFLNGGDVNYLHQLQNLYFALTNEELLN